MMAKKTQGKKAAKNTGLSVKRVRNQPTHRTLRFTKKRLKQPKPIPGAFSLLRQTFRLIIKNPRSYGLLFLISVLTSLVFVQGFGSAFDISELKQNVEEFLGEDSNKLGTAFALFSYMLGSAGSGSSELAGAYQLFLTLIISLATIWLTRQLLADEKPLARDAFYKGMYPLVPFLLILIVIGLQLLPLMLGNLLFSTVIQNGLAVTALEKIIWFVLFALLALLSLYMVLSSLFALYIATLPDMTPMKALRSARELVLHRRFAVALRMLALPLVMLAMAFVLLIPMLIFIPPVAQFVFLFMTSASVILFNVYTYLLYRGLL